MNIIAVVFWVLTIIIVWLMAREIEKCRKRLMNAHQEALDALKEAAWWENQFKQAQSLDCGFGCDWVYPYGFVPEAGCPVHDRYEKA